MARTVAIGLQNFENIRTRNVFYVDKTNFIKEWWESKDDVTLITRPRRFGKTLNMDMLNCFFSNEYADRGDLFEGLSIWNEEKYRQLQGTYPVIFISFAGVKDTDFDGMSYTVCKQISDIYESNRYLLEGDLLSDNEKDYFKSVNTKMPLKVAENALNSLSNFISRYYKKKVIILVDEYDTPMQEAWINGYWNEAVAFFRSLFNTLFKTNPYIERGIITGITRISKESIFSDLNHIKVVTVGSDMYADCFGFTQKEVSDALAEYDLSDQKDAVKEWYDGFTFGRYTDIYNPWSIINYLDNKKIDSYWSNTSSNGLINSLLQKGDANVKQILEGLIKGEAFNAKINEDIVFAQLDSDNDAIWSLMLAAGYLKVEKIEADEYDTDVYTLNVANRETVRFLRDMISRWFSKYKGLYYSDFIESFLKGDIEEMNICMNDITETVFSFYDVGSGKKWKQAESFYHGFVLGLMVELARDYVLRSNRESGRGRYDVMLIPKGDRDAMIIEFKAVRDDKKETLESALQMALEQIESKNYEQELISMGITKDRIKKYGFAFEGKTVLIGTKEDN